jgi:hypothetical protein
MRYFEIVEPSAGYISTDSDTSDAAHKLRRALPNGAEDKQSRLRIDDQRQCMKSEAKPKD